MKKEISELVEQESQSTEVCNDCHGYGTVYQIKCDFCEGTGRMDKKISQCSAELNAVLDKYGFRLVPQPVMPNNEVCMVDVFLTDVQGHKGLFKRIDDIPF